VTAEEPVVRGSKTLELETCNMVNTPCRHCSREHIYRPCTRIQRDPNSKIYKPIGLDRIKIDLGLYCNDAGKYVDEMQYCPVKWSKANWNKMLADYLKKEEAKKKRELKKPVKVTKPVKKVIKKPIKKQIKRLTKVTNVKPQKKKFVSIKKSTVKK
jgi:hypothetical protein